MAAAAPKSTPAMGGAGDSIWGMSLQSGTPNMVAGAADEIGRQPVV
jgi:hypothetical protein